MARILTVQILVDTETDAGSTDGLNELFHSAEGFVLDWGYKRPDGSYVEDPVGTEYIVPDDYVEGEFIEFIDPPARRK